METCPHCLKPINAGTQVCPFCGVPIPTPLELPKLAYLKSGDYQIISTLGRGGFGITYLAADKRLNRNVAIKEFFSEGSARTQSLVYNQNSTEFLESKQRFLEEAQVLARFEHSGIVRVFDVFEDNNTAYLVMEALQGKTLAKALESGAILPSHVQELARNLCATLEVVHRAGWLHRDIKPENVFITQDDRVVLIDFGSARKFQNKRTMHHTRLVTIGYAAPEQFASSAQFGAFTDLYGLSATLYHALMGKPPPSATDRFVGAVVPSLESDVPLGLRQAIEKGLALKVGERPQSAREFVLLLESKKVIQNPVLNSSKQFTQTGGVYFQRDNLRITPSEIVLDQTTKLGGQVSVYKKHNVRNVGILERNQPFFLTIWHITLVLGIIYFFTPLMAILPIAIGAIVLVLTLVGLVLGSIAEKERSNAKIYDVVIFLTDGSEVTLYYSTAWSWSKEVYSKVQQFLA